MFKVLFLEIKNHPVLKDIKVSFTDAVDEKSVQYVSLIIGSNGTGKTQILRSVINILTTISDITNNTNKWAEKYDFKIEMLVNNKKYVFESSEGSIKHDKIEVEDIGICIPTKILVSAYTFDDKFPKIKEHARYKYLGLKTTTNNIFLRNPSKDTFESISKILLQNDSRIEYLNRILNELKLNKRIKVNYAKRSNFKILLDQQFIDLIKKIKKSPNKDDTINNSIPNLIDVITHFSKINESGRRKRIQDDAIRRFLKDSDGMFKMLSYLSDIYDIENPTSIKLDFSYNWEDNHNEEALNTEFKLHAPIYDYFADMDIVSFDSFLVSRDDYFDFRETSSGEFHLLHLTSSILSNITDNSLIIIDEPEISLHVTWQNMFFHLISPIIEKYSSCHFIIASHSHFLVSNLKRENSAIITLKRNLDGGIIVRNLEESKIDANGWSAEQILFEVFEVATDRNYYLSQLVSDIVNEMSSIKPKNEIINQKIQELSKNKFSNLNDNDPMKIIIDNLLEK